MAMAVSMAMALPMGRSIPIARADGFQENYTTAAGTDAAQPMFASCSSNCCYAVHNDAVLGNWLM